MANYMARHWKPEKNEIGLDLSEGEAKCKIERHLGCNNSTNFFSKLFFKKYFQLNIK